MNYQLNLKVIRVYTSVHFQLCSPRIDSHPAARAFAFLLTPTLRFFAKPMAHPANGFLSIFLHENVFFFLLFRINSTSMQKCMGSCDGSTTLDQNPMVHIFIPLLCSRIRVLPGVKDSFSSFVSGRFPCRYNLPRPTLSFRPAFL